MNSRDEYSSQRTNLRDGATAAAAQYRQLRAIAALTPDEHDALLGLLYMHLGYKQQQQPSLPPK